MNILYVISSPRGRDSYSTRVAEHVVQQLRDSHPGGRVVVRDLANSPLPHIDADFVAATRTQQGPRNDTQRAALAQSDRLVDELLAADVVVIAAPMINFGVPSTLKAWIDTIARPGRTFSYSAAGPKGLATGKHVIIVSASGGIYSSGQAAALDFQLPWLKSVLAFLGMTDVEVIRIEGTALGAEAAETALQRAHAAAGTIVAARRSLIADLEAQRRAATAA